MNYFNQNQNQNYNPMAPAQAQPMAQPGVAPNPYQMPVQPQMNPMQPGMVNPMYQQPQVPGAYNQPVQPQMNVQPAAVPGFGGMMLPPSLDAVKNTLTIHVGAISEDIRQIVSNLINYHINRKADIAGEIARVDKKGYILQVDYMPGTDTNPTFSIRSNTTQAMNGAMGAIQNIGGATINGWMLNNIAPSGDQLTALESSFNAVIEKFDKVVQAIRAAQITNGAMELGYANISVINGVILLTPSTLVLNNFKRDYAKMAMK